ncbi:MAG TPA: hemolysin family protein [Actinomycetota bacterium]|nr:hemolysin family protein [Actinomycetota bacterium]
MNIWYLVAALLLLLANGFFVGAEFALIAARQSKIEQLADEGRRTASVAHKLIRELTLSLAGAQLGITMCSLGLGYVAEPAVAHLIESGLSSWEIPDGVLHPVSFTIALTIITFLHMVVGEMAPKNVAIAEPEKSILWVALPFRVFVTIFRPIIHVLNAIANAGVRVLRIEPINEYVSAHTAAEIGYMVKESARHGALHGSEERLLSGAAGFGERDATAAMIPRTEIVAVPEDATPADVEGAAFASGHTRFPIFRGDLDDILGFVHVKDLLRIDQGDRDKPLPRWMIRQMLVVPESLNLHPLLIMMRRERRHLALVVDEHGGTAGIVTLEDLLEELVGEIRDEYDFSELGVEVLGEERYLVPGSLRIDEAADRLNVRLPEGEYETVAGFLMDRLGRIPRRGDVVEHEKWRLRVLIMQRRRVVQVLIEDSR